MKARIYTIETEWVREFGGDMTATLDNPYDRPKAYPTDDTDRVQAYESIDLPAGYTIEKCPALDNALFVCDDRGCPCRLTADRDGRTLNVASGTKSKTIALTAIFDPMTSPDRNPATIKPIR